MYFVLSLFVVNAGLPRQGTEATLVLDREARESLLVLGGHTFQCLSSYLNNKITVKDSIPRLLACLVYGDSLIFLGQSTLSVMCQLS